MPIYKDQTFISRIFKGETEIKRVYKGKGLVWGIYEVTFHDRDIVTSTDSKYQPKRYVGGIRYEIMPELDDYFDEYKTHYDGGYEDNQFIVAIPYISKEVHKDFDLYAKWRQRKYSYGGVVRYGTVEVTPSDIRDEPPTPNDSDYPGSGGAGLSMPNCTGYVYYRAQEAGASAPTSGGYGDAGGWWLNHPGSEWTSYAYDEDGEPGDVLVYSGHVAFVEGDGEISESVFTEYLWDGTALPRSGTAEDLYDFCIEHGNDTARSYFNPSQSGGSLGTRYWSKRSTTRGGSEYLGRLHYTGEGSGGVIENGDDEPYNVSKTECGKLPEGGSGSPGDQDNPDFPDANLIKRGETSPSGEYRDSFWDTQVQYTDIRQGDYENGDGSAGSSESNTEGLFG